MFCIIQSQTGVIAVVGNALVFLAIVKTESLHSPSNIALCCLTATDFITGLVTQPCGSSRVFYGSPADIVCTAFLTIASLPSA